MSSQKSSKADLLVRVRYQNPLPAPPVPPKLLHIPTTPLRYATYDFLAPIQGERELPMILDAELGMPLELGKTAPGAPSMGGDYWLGNRSGPSRSSLLSLPVPGRGIRALTALKYAQLSPRLLLRKATRTPTSQTRTPSSSKIRPLLQLRQQPAVGPARPVEPTSSMSARKSTSVGCARPSTSVAKRATCGTLSKTLTGARSLFRFMLFT